MNFFAFKISDESAKELVDSIKNNGQDIMIQQLNQLSDQLQVGSKVFVQLGGDKVEWEKGLIGLAEVIKAPYDQQYDKSNPRNFRIKIKMLIVLDTVIKREDFRFYKDVYDAAGIGPNTRGEQNQAIKSLEDIQAYTILRAMAEMFSGIDEEIKKNLF